MRQMLWSLACVFALAGCFVGTDAVGVAECRAFESVRCEAAVACGFPNVEECVRYERDHCLHGVRLESISAIQLDACAQDVGRAGRCAAEQGRNTLASACSEPIASTASSTACDVVTTPERANACAFLVPDAVPAPVAPAPSTPADAGS